jgi:1-acyl-sn-glycerol-3-phosphate acyltransferase
MLRSAWYVVKLFVWTIYYSSKAVVAGWLKIPNLPGGVYDECGRRWGVRVLRAAGVTVRTVGMEHIATDHPIVYVSNHQSLIDILALAATIPGKMRFVAKKELSKVPVFGAALKAAGQIYIDRHNRAKAFEAYEEAAAAVQAGMNAVVFAEGTRSRTGQLLPFKKGPFVFAIASQVPIIPIYCAGTFDVLPKASVWVRPGPITIYYGEQIPTGGLTYDDRAQLMQTVRTIIERFEADFKRGQGGAEGS